MPRKRLIVGGAKLAQAHQSCGQVSDKKLPAFSLLMESHTRAGRACFMKHVVQPTHLVIPDKLFAAIPSYVKGESANVSPPHIVQENEPLTVSELELLAPVSDRKKKKKHKKIKVNEGKRNATKLSQSAAEVLLSGTEKELLKWRESRWFQTFYEDQLRNKISICAAIPSDGRDSIKSIVDDALTSEDSSRKLHLIHGETGSGKSTQVPQIILDELITRRVPGRIIVSQPRRIAATTLAERVATERGQDLGSSIGYQISGDRLFARGAATIDYCTAGYLANSLTDVLDNARESNKALFIIVDEIHDRGLVSDLLLYRLRHNLDEYKITIIFMSATANMELLKNYFIGFDMSQIFLPGKTFGVEQYYQDDLSQLGHFKVSNSRLEPTQIVNIITFLVSQRSIPGSVIQNKGIPPTGSVLVFLPGKPEILGIRELLQKRNPDLNVVKLYRGCSKEEFRKAFKSEIGKTKIVLTTNIAESSITIPDVTLVLNTGLARTSLMKAGTRVLMTAECSKSSNQQRAGRAGRVQRGVCIHLFSKASHNRRRDHPEAEAVNSPLANIALKIINFDCFGSNLRNVLENLIEPPISDTVNDAISELVQLGAVRVTSKGDYKKTQLGILLGSLWLLPRDGYFVLLACALGCLDWAVVHLQRAHGARDFHEVQDAVLLSLSRSGINSIGMTVEQQQCLSVNRLCDNNALTSAAKTVYQTNRLSKIINEDNRRVLVSRNRCFNLNLPRKPDGWFIIENEVLLADGFTETHRLTYANVEAFISLIILSPALRAIQYKNDQSVIGLVVNDWAVFTMPSHQAECLMSYNDIIQKVLRSHFALGESFENKTSEEIVDSLANFIWAESNLGSKPPTRRVPISTLHGAIDVSATVKNMMKFGKEG